MWDFLRSTSLNEEVSMRLYEYQAKEILREYGVPVPQGEVARDPVEVRKAMERLPVSRAVLKVQIKAGGRGKGGGVAFFEEPEEAEAWAEGILGKAFSTYQTGGRGERVEALLVEEAVEVEKEFYLGVVLDRSRGRFVLLGVPEGGVEVEEVAERSPELIVREEIDPLLGLQPFQVRRMAFRMGLSPEVLGLWRDLLGGMWQAVLEKEMLLCEINPLVLTQRWTFMALDAKVELDENALRRHPELKELVSAPEDPLEEWAKRYGLNYIKLRGNVGCLVNGAGLAMATMDLVKLAGGEPANFLDVGGGATVEMVKEGLKILHADPEVKVIFVNIFGGILRCDTLARGMIEASKEVEFDRPIVIRMEGTNVEEGRRILASSDLRLITAQEMDEAARRITEILKEG